MHLYTISPNLEDRRRNELFFVRRDMHDCLYYNEKLETACGFYCRNNAQVETVTFGGGFHQNNMN